MRTTKLLNTQWQFHQGEIDQPYKTAKKAHALGGLTAALPAEAEQRVRPSAGGVHFLKLIAQGNLEDGLRNLAGTDLTSQLDETWKTVDLPHDWKVDLPYVNDPQNLMSGSKPDGVGYYRKVFTLADDLFQNNRLVLHFDGVMRMADVWLNGVYLAHNNSGYTAMDLDVTEMANYGNEGPNVVLVRVDTTTGPEGWWYEGAGIYKSVWLEQVPLTAIDTDSAYVYTKTLQDDQAQLGIEVTVENYHDAPIEVVPKVVIGSQVVNLATGQIPAHQSQQFKQTLTLHKPRLWTPETPNLYQVTFTVADDQVTKQFGVHTFDYQADGFYLNHQLYELHGVCEHQDMAGVGVALDQDLVNYKVHQMKKMGVNAWRSAHHFASTELLTAADEQGLILINENRLLESSPWRIADLEKMVKRSRMHASVGFWSIANEEIIGNTSLGNRIAKRLVRAVKTLDHEHLVMSAELLNPQGEVDRAYLQNFDVLGVNYPEAGVMGAGAELIKQQYPELPMMSTENASYFSTRGVYRDNGDQCQCNNFGSMYSMVLPGKRQPGDPGVGGTAHPETVMAYLKAHSYMGGVFLWTAFDYFGEPSPFGWPGTGSQFGIADSCGFPKDYYYYYQAHWTTPWMVHVMPSWNKSALDLDDQDRVAIRAFSNAQTVELIINDKSYGRQTVQDCQVNWLVPYNAGELQVKAYQDGQLVAQDSQQTSGAVTDIKITPIYEGQNKILYELQGIDGHDQPVPTTNAQVVLTVGDGEIVGTGNGNPANTELASATQITLFNGKALVIVQKFASTCQLTAKLN
ncbi:glycoside hydrolase family 2 TIM barrel-domain containing protein [Lactiplantibacillus mudanjiangensis]|uniref:Glycoside hydrolase family 2 [Lactobacillus pentosus] n=1 Tax=Lactiplantibacillus mudanjiangensis TaxID=1296538 RepID=A0A660E2E7_9LACO|nr:glycoside hydrolase family 2 TIM barrel-domain containing protein [Lactiplantibacillus mudanjiangensis]VDG22502.1 glycoside hydrolase family 2 [Lactobacillus pentosus] [Lactiplantibacillus mudanjiangensis]VDG26948.1 glycoside hydrolase family 2 [Lactobacillus pentosus] [Lactiplantibacillus mudanjiangensis]